MQSQGWLATILAVTIATAPSGVAQDQSTLRRVTFKARLSPVALDTSMLDTIAGSGSATGVLADAKLTVTGEFQGMKSAATRARIHAGSMTGVRGPAVFDLTVEKSVSGKLSGTFNLTAPQVDIFRKGCFYIQIDSEKAPEGNLWGWLLPQGGS